MNKLTKKYKNESVIYHLFSWLCLILPALWYSIPGFIKATSEEKLILGLTVIVAGILTAVNFIMKSSLRSAFWVLALGIVVVCDKYLGMIVMMAVCTFLDELIFTPLSKKYHNLYVINKEIDKRGRLET